METDYISREAAIGMAVSGRIRALPTTEDGEDWIRVEEVRESLKRVPPADVRPVVYCKDCKWYRESELLAPNRFCFRLKGNDGKPVGYNFAPNDFCSYGERRDGGADG